MGEPDLEALYRSSTFVGCSLWLTPSSGRSALDNIMEPLAKRCNGPLFTPHCTLLAGLSGSEADIVGTTKELAGTLPSTLLLEVDKVGTKGLYFQCVFALLKKTDSLVEAHEKAAQMFGLEGTTENYMPHISLLYGDVDEAVREEIVKNANGDDLLTDIVFEVKSIDVWCTQGSVDEWRFVASIPLGPRPDDTK